MISLSKGQKISLSKEGGPQLKRVAVGLGWGMRETQTKGFFGIGAGVKHEEVDLDASCILYDADGNAVDSVWWRKLRSNDGSIQHTGDDREGGGSEDDPNEVINVDLDKVPEHVRSIVFVVNSYTGETFKGIPTAFCNVVDLSNQGEVARFNLNTSGGDARGFIIAKVYRHEGQWKFHAIGEQVEGRQQTVKDIEVFARKFA
ncbi:TerD family protein [Myxococcota bacterium]|nr:TerD family protein [Myxococcota bacterium]